MLHTLCRPLSSGTAIIKTMVSCGLDQQALSILFHLFQALFVTRKFFELDKERQHDKKTNKNERIKHSPKNSQPV
jgi:hypothetical protein